MKKIVQILNAQRLVLASFILISFFASGQSVSSDRIIDSAKHYLDRLMPDPALELLIPLADTMNLSSDVGIRARIAMAEAYRSKRDYNRGIKTIYEVLEEENISNYDLAHAYNRLAALYNENTNRDETRFDSVMKYSNYCISIAQKHSFDDLLASSYNEKAYILSRDTRFIDAAPYYEQALNIYLDIGKNNHAVGVAINYASNLMSRDMPKEANQIIDTAFTFVPKEGNENLWMRLYLQRAKINELAGNWEEAYHALSYGRILQKQYYNSKLDETIVEMSAKYELDKQQLKLEEEKRKSKARQREVVMLLTLLVITAILFGLSYRSFMLKSKVRLQKEKLDIAEKQRLKEHLDHKSNQLSGAIANAVAYNEVMEKVKNAISNEKAKEALQIINSNIDTQKNWQDFLLSFNEMHPDFFSILKKKHPELTENDTKLAAMLLLGMKTKEMAGVLNVEVSTINKGRQRLRKRVGLESKVSLVDYFQSW